MEIERDFHEKFGRISKILYLVKSPKAIFRCCTEIIWDVENIDKYQENAFYFRLTGKKKLYELVEGKDGIKYNNKFEVIYWFTRLWRIFSHCNKDKLFTINDAKEVWIWLNIFEQIKILLYIKN